MARWLRITLKIVGAFIGLMLIVVIGCSIYISTHKDEILKKVTSRVNEHINGTLSIGDVNTSFLDGFPNIGIQLDNVQLRDSLWQTHRHDLLRAGHIYVHLNPLTLLGKVKIHRVDIEDASVYLFTDSLGYSNTSVFRKDTTTNDKKRREALLRNFELENVNFVLENKSKNKLFAFHVKTLNGGMRNTKQGWKVNLETETLVKQFCFNTEKGSYLKDKTIEGSFDLVYLAEEQQLEVKKNKIHISDQPVEVGATFVFKNKPAAFRLDITANKVLLQDAVSMLSPNISSKFTKIDFKKPLDVHADINGYMKYRDTPLINVTYKVKNNTIVTPFSTFEDVNFTGYFMNNVVPGNGHNDPNSVVAVKGLEAEVFGIPFRCDSVKMFNLKHPLLEARIAANFPVQKLNDASGGRAFRFDDGDLAMNLYYKGKVERDSSQPYWKGDIKISKAVLEYVPRGTKFQNVNATIVLDGTNLSIPAIQMQRGSSAIGMSGYAQNFLSLFYRSPDRIVLNWSVASNYIDLNDFSPFLTARKKRAEKIKKDNAGSNFAHQMDQVLEASTANLRVKVGKFKYRKFQATNINANIALTMTGINLQQVSLNHAGGTIGTNGVISTKGSVNPFALKAKMTNVNVHEVFTAFDNFGQDAIVADNIKGTLSADINARGQMREGGKIVPGSIYGTVDFVLRNGTLIDFEPFQKISKYVFKKRNLSYITFKDIENRLELKGDKVVINPMHIESSAINMDVAGVYGFKGGTDIKLEVPLRNPKKEEQREQRNKKKKGKGIVLYLRATDGPDGNVKISWDKSQSQAVPDSLID